MREQLSFTTMLCASVSQGVSYEHRHIILIIIICLWLWITSSLTTDFYQNIIDLISVTSSIYFLCGKLMLILSDVRVIAYKWWSKQRSYKHSIYRSKVFCCTQNCVYCIAMFVHFMLTLNYNTYRWSGHFLSRHWGDIQR